MSKFSTAILSSNLYILKSEVTNLENLKMQLTVYSKFDKDVADPIIMYDESRRGMIGVPLFYFRSPEYIADTVVDERTIGVLERFVVKTSLWDGQRQIIETFKSFLSEGKTGFVIQSKPGTGKTLIMAQMLSLLGRKALVVVPRSNLVQQWKERLLEHTDLKPGEIGTAMERQCDFVGKKVVVGLVHSLALDRYGEEFKRSFGCIAFDEVDRSVPPTTFAPVVSMFKAKFRLGCSATVTRADGLDVILEKHVGQVFIKGTDENRMRPKVLVHRFHRPSGPVDFIKTMMNRRGRLLSLLAANQERNRVIADYVVLIRRSGRRCMVLSDRTEQLVGLKRILTGLGIAKDDIGFYAGSLWSPKSGKDVEESRKVLEKERKQTAKCSGVILATYAMAQLGTDIKTLAGLVFATPQSDVEQAKGRIERLAEGKLQPIIVDIVDTFYEDTRRWFLSRMRHYKKEMLFVKDGE